MPIFNWPYTDLHSLNLDWIIKKIKGVETAEANSAASASDAAASKTAAAGSAAAANTSKNNAAASAEAAAGSAQTAQNLVNQLDTTIAQDVSDWLNTHITPTTPAVDDTLTVSGAAADAAVTGEKITDLKTGITDTTGNTIITEWVDGWFVSTNGATYNPNGAVLNASFRYAFIDCVEGDIFTVSGEGGGNPRLWAFADSNNNVLSRSSADLMAENLVITAPTGASRLILNDKNKTHNSYKNVLLISKVESLNDYDDELTENINVISERIEDVDGITFIDRDEYELGNITITSNGWSYTNSSSRVRTKENYNLFLDVGDIIRLKDYTRAEMYIGYQTYNDAYGATGWLRDDYTAVYGGKHAILIRGIPESAQTNKDNLLNLLEIVKYKNNKQKTNILYAMNSPVMAVNHRGFNRTAPENTIPAFKLSKEYGFSHVETDISWTSDGVPVCLHDRSINRTARNADGTTIANTINIDEITYEQALTYDFGIWKSDRYAGTKIPTFDQYSKTCKMQGVGMFVEVKSYGFTVERLTALLEKAKENGVLEHIVWLSFDDSILSAIKTLSEDAKLMLLASSVNASIINTANALKTAKNVVYIATDAYAGDAVELCKNNDIPLAVYTINNKDTMNALPMYISGVTSDLYSVNVEWYEE